MTGNDLRKRFLDFFAARDHIVVPPSSLIPDDPSVLFTTAGMQQFKSYYTGEMNPATAIHPSLGKPVGKNAVSVQPSFRTSDIDDVGDESHLTFFEMLGNFSFGGYFKEGAIRLAHEFITKELMYSLDYVTVFEGDADVPRDAESETIWHCVDPAIEVRHQNRGENFWGPTGDRGPCGPTTELYVDGVEIWNLVFNEYFCHPGGRLEKLATPGVDTGMGLERLARVAQKTETVFETDLFTPLMRTLAPSRDRVERREQSDTSFDRLFRPGRAFQSDVNHALQDSQILRARRIVADHLRGAAFLTAEGVEPSNQERGYVVRRLLRRALRYARTLDLPDQFHRQFLHALDAVYGEAYPALLNQASLVEETMQKEFERFGATLKKGEERLARLIERRQTESSGVISGDDAFDLYQSYGFPLELTEELASEREFTVDREAFETARERHQERSRAGREAKFGGHGLLLDTGELKARDPGELTAATKLHTATHLLHAALRKALGDHVRQMGSDITADRLRFDFSHPGALTPEERKQVETIVNDAIRQNLPVTREEMPYEEAMRRGALAFFREKYPPIVSVYTVGDPAAPFSRECCGGPHVAQTGEIGTIAITKEESVGAGVRRIRATLKNELSR